MNAVNRDEVIRSYAVAAVEEEEEEAIMLPLLKLAASAAGLLMNAAHSRKNKPNMNLAIVSGRRRGTSMVMMFCGKPRHSTQRSGSFLTRLAGIEQLFTGKPPFLFACDAAKDSFCFIHS